MIEYSLVRGHYPMVLFPGNGYFIEMCTFFGNAISGNGCQLGKYFDDNTHLWKFPLFEGNQGVNLSCRILMYIFGVFR